MSPFYSNTSLNKTSFLRFLEQNLSSAVIKNLALNCRFVLRSRKFDPVVFFAACTDACADKEWSLSSIHSRYNYLMHSLGRDGISWEPFHDFLIKPQFKSFITAISNKIHDFALQQRGFGLSASLVQALTAKLDIDDVVLQDGCEVTLHAQALASKFKGKILPTAKIHLTLSLRSLLPLASVITSGVASETDNLPWSALSRKLLIADAGYESQRLFNAVSAHNGYFLIKVNTSCMYQVLYQTVIDENGCSERCVSPTDNDCLPIGVSHHYNRDKRNRDIIAITSQGYRLRIVRLWNPSGKYYVNLATNIPPDCLDLYQIMALYRARWQIERKFRIYKGFCAARGSRSSYPHIQETMLLLSQLCADFKQIMALFLENVSGKLISPEKIAHYGQSFIQDLLRAMINGHSFKRFISKLCHCVTDFMRRKVSYINLKRGKCLSWIIARIERPPYLSPLVSIWEELP